MYFFNLLSKGDVLLLVSGVGTFSGTAVLEVALRLLALEGGELLRVGITIVLAQKAYGPFVIVLERLARLSESEYFHGQG